MKFGNYMILEFPSKSSNEAFARSAVACFAAQMDPTLEELGDIRTAVSEAVTNCIVHAYPDKLGTITLLLDAAIVAAGGLLYRDFDGMVYGMIVAYLLSVMVDKMFYGLNAGKVAWIITGNPDLVYAVIDRVSERGATIITAQGAYRREEKHMLMVASSVKEMFRIVREVRKADPATFIVVQEAEGVHGEGFAFHSAAQEP